MKMKEEVMNTSKNKNYVNLNLEIVISKTDLNKKAETPYYYVH